MENLFAALRDLVPGSDVLDVRFLTNQSEEAEGSVADLDKKLGVALDGAQQSDIASIA